MDNDTENSLRALQLGFIGKIIADFTHEIKNHLAFIKESAGLIEDLIGSKKSLEKHEIRQTVDVLHSIVNQIGKSVNMFNYLNRFSHRMDNPISTFNINDILEELFVLLNRFANQKKISLKTDFQKDIFPFSGDPTRLQFIIFCLIDEMINKLDKNSRIIAKTMSFKNSITVQLVMEGNVITSDEEKTKCPQELLQYLITQLGWNLLREDKKLIVTIPLSF
jgi:nitrogen fixation/metabolism regulation signal transduction histidine kinase